MNSAEDTSFESIGHTRTRLDHWIGSTLAARTLFSILISEYLFRLWLIEEMDEKERVGGAESLY